MQGTRCTHSVLGKSWSTDHAWIAVVQEAFVVARTHEWARDTRHARKGPGSRGSSLHAVYRSILYDRMAIDMYERDRTVRKVSESKQKDRLLQVQILRSNPAAAVLLEEIDADVGQMCAADTSIDDWDHRGRYAAL